MQYSDIPTLIRTICADNAASFQLRTTRLFERLQKLNREMLTLHIEYGGVIPESYSHDSTEEKLFAKYCDYLLAEALAALGMQAKVIEERADAADVEAKTSSYSLVGDAKAFRLSRTAKNQKDFKVEALNQWKGQSNYACLVCPLYQYPTTSSQIYSQAIRYNVTLLSYAHLGFLLRAEKIDRKHFDKVWTVSAGLAPSKNAVPYWNAVNAQVALAASSSVEAWDKYLLDSKKLLRSQAEIQLAYWESEKERIRGLTHDQAVEALIGAMRIDSNIASITKTIGDLEEIIAEID